MCDVIGYMGKARRIEELDVWKTGRELANVIYDLTNSGEFTQDFGLKDQIRRAAVGGMSNIAEGFHSRTDRGFANYLGIARASLGEVKSQLYLALDRKYIDHDGFEFAYELCDKSARQISKLMQYLEEDRTTYDV